MGRFYFHLQADDQIVPDDEGVDLPDLSAAEHEAILAARELLAEAIKSGRPEVPEAFVIADEEGRALAIVPFTAVFSKPPRKKGSIKMLFFAPPVGGGGGRRGFPTTAGLAP